MTENPELVSMEEQLIDLYKEREALEEALGTADSKAVIALVKSMEEQLRDVYKDRDAAFS